MKYLLLLCLCSIASLYTKAAAGVELRPSPNGLLKGGQYNLQRAPLEMFITHGNHTGKLNVIFIPFQWDFWLVTELEESGPREIRPSRMSSRTKRLWGSGTSSMRHMSFPNLCPSLL